MTSQPHPRPPAFTNFLMWKLWWLRRILNVELSKLANSHFISESALEVLLELMQAPDGLTQRELADTLRLRGPTISVAIDKAVESGLVRRRPDEEDGRAWRVTLERNAPTKQLAEQFELYESTLKEKYTKEELRLVGRVLDDWISLLKGDSWLPWSKKGD
ncbi:MAG: MarR family transcriptional regulator [Archangium sp.]|nr:MarR family transcriptional regulator [Archangium sp.]